MAETELQEALGIFHFSDFAFDNSNMDQVFTQLQTPTAVAGFCNFLIALSGVFKEKQRQRKLSEWYIQNMFRTYHDLARAWRIAGEPDARTFVRKTTEMRKKLYNPVVQDHRSINRAMLAVAEEGEFDWGDVADRIEKLLIGHLARERLALESVASVNTPGVEKQKQIDALQVTLGGLIGSKKDIDLLPAVNRKKLDARETWSWIGWRIISYLGKAEMEEPDLAKIFKFLEDRGSSTSGGCFILMLTEDIGFIFHEADVTRFKPGASTANVDPTEAIKGILAII